MQLMICKWNLVISNSLVSDTDNNKEYYNAHLTLVLI